MRTGQGKEKKIYLVSAKKHPIVFPEKNPVEFLMLPDIHTSTGRMISQHMCALCQKDRQKRNPRWPWNYRVCAAGAFKFLYKMLQILNKTMSKNRPIKDIWWRCSVWVHVHWTNMRITKQTVGFMQDAHSHLLFVTDPSSTLTLKEKTLIDPRAKQLFQQSKLNPNMKIRWKTYFPEL